MFLFRLLLITLNTHTKLELDLQVLQNQTFECKLKNLLKGVSLVV